MDIRKIAIAAAVGSFLTMGVAGVASAGDTGNSAKCYGVAKAGQERLRRQQPLWRRPGEEGQRPERVEAHAQGRAREMGRTYHASAEVIQR